MQQLCMHNMRLDFHGMAPHTKKQGAEGSNVTWREHDNLAGNGLSDKHDEKVGKPLGDRSPL